MNHDLELDEIMKYQLVRQARNYFGGVRRFASTNDLSREWRRNKEVELGDFAWLLCVIVCLSRVNVQSS